MVRSLKWLAGALAHVALLALFAAALTAEVDRRLWPPREPPVNRALESDNQALKAENAVLLAAAREKDERHARQVEALEKKVTTLSGALDELRRTAILFPRLQPGAGDMIPPQNVPVTPEDGKRE
jgi:hypothetical protein